MAKKLMNQVITPSIHWNAYQVLWYQPPGMGEKMKGNYSPFTKSQVFTYHLVLFSIYKDLQTSMMMYFIFPKL